MVETRVIQADDSVQGAHSVSADLIEVIASWSEVLHGGGSLSDAFRELVRVLGAEAGVFVRRVPGGAFARVIALIDEKGDRSGRPLRGSLADNLFGSYLDGARPATVWLASEHADETDATASAQLTVWQSARKCREMAVLVLANTAHARDHIELHFSQPLGPECVARIGAILPTLVRTWNRRSAGVVSLQATEKHAAGDTDPAPLEAGVPLLSMGNPAGLSRAEFRVCVLLSRGLSVKGLLAELGLSEATVRSHLRSIYSKTGARSLAELVFRLMEARGDEASPALRRA